MTLLEQAKEAVRRSRDFVPSNGRHYSAPEVETLYRLCAEAVKACEAAGTTISQMRLELYREEREEHRAKLQAICDEFKAAALARGEVTV
jgi:hypothetical protein